MTDAGWGTDWLPPGIARRMARDDAAETRRAREQAAEREQQAEERHQRALNLAAGQAEGRGEYVSALAIANGQVPGRTFADIFAAAVAAGAREDQVAAARASREPGELAHVFVDEPVIARARSKTGLAMFNNYRRFREAQRAKAKAAAAADASRDDWGIVEADYTDRTGWDRPSERSAWPSGDDVRIRFGGHIAGIQ